MSDAFTTPGSTTASRFSASIDDDAREPIEADEHRVVVGERAAGESGAGAARHEGAAGGGERAHHRDELVARAREHRERAGARRCVGQRVGGVDLELGGARDHAARADDPGEHRGERIAGCGGGGHGGQST